MLPEPWGESSYSSVLRFIIYFVISTGMKRSGMEWRDLRLVGLGRFLDCAAASLEMTWWEWPSPLQSLEGLGEVH